MLFISRISETLKSQYSNPSVLGGLVLHGWFDLVKNLGTNYVDAGQKSTGLLNAGTP